MKKVALFVFNGDPVCFVHVLLNALDMRARDCEVRIVVEGAATELIPALYGEDHPLNGLWKKALDADLVEGVCTACAQKMGTLEASREKGLGLLDRMNGHPSMAEFREQGYDIITF